MIDKIPYFNATPFEVAEQISERSLTLFQMIDKDEITGYKAVSELSFLFSDMTKLIQEMIRQLS